MEMRRVTEFLGRTYPLETELLLVGLVLVAWHAIRIPIEGDVATSLAHADDILGIERTLSLDIEAWIIASTESIASTLEWLYTNVHLPVLFGFVAAVRLLAPDRYPLLRTTFVLSFVPAALVIWLYPLAPPHWLPEFGFGVPPTDAELANTTGAIFHNTTAAAASQHFGFALFVAAASIWLFPRSPYAWATHRVPDARLRRHRRNRKSLPAGLRRRRVDVRAGCSRRVTPRPRAASAGPPSRRRAGSRASRSGTHSSRGASSRST